LLYLSSGNPELFFKILRISLFGAAAISGIPENRVSRKTVGELWDVKQLTEVWLHGQQSWVCMYGLLWISTMTQFELLQQA